MRSALLLILGLSMALPAHADREDEPEQGPSTRLCAAGQVWDGGRRTCVPIRGSQLTDPARLDLAHELAVFGRAQDALGLLEGLEHPETTEALTLRGFATRKAGDMPGGLVLYRRALRLDPQNWQARAYLGGALLEIGDRAGAEAQLMAIRTSGGRGSFPERALAGALTTGRPLYGGPINGPRANDF